MNNGNGVDVGNVNNKPGTFIVLKSVTKFKACGKKVITNNEVVGGSSSNQLATNTQTKRKKKRMMDDGKLNPKTVEMLRKKTKFSK